MNAAEVGQSTRRAPGIRRLASGLNMDAAGRITELSQALFCPFKASDSDHL